MHGPGARRLPGADGSTRVALCAQVIVRAVHSRRVLQGSLACFVAWLTVPSGRVRFEAESVRVQRKDEYGNEVQREARPLPIEYLLLDMPCGTPLDPEYTLSSRSPAHLAIENRAPSMPAQDVHAFSQYLRASLPSLFSAPASVSPMQILQALSDLHVLFFLASNEFVPFQVCSCALQLHRTRLERFLCMSTLRTHIRAQGDELQALVKAVASGNEREAESVLHGGTWQTLLRAIEAAASSRACCFMPHVTSINH